jgi:hypothetical protein
MRPNQVVIAVQRLDGNVMGTASPKPPPREMAILGGLYLQAHLLPCLPFQILMTPVRKSSLLSLSLVPTMPQVCISGRISGHAAFCS